MKTVDTPAVQVINESAVGPFVFVCEHASNRIPTAFDHIGISTCAQQSHSGWDIGALALSTALSNKLASPLVASTVSRLIYDCNRAPDSATAIVPRSETEDIPGNQELSPTLRSFRVDTVYYPFSQALNDLLEKRQMQNIDTCLVTVHSFTPIFQGQVRTVELGVLHDNDSRFADLLLSIATKHTTLVVERNQPYGPSDDVTHTLQKHALPRNMANVMLEIKNDLLLEPASIEAIGDSLSLMLTEAITEFSESEFTQSNANKNPI